MNLEEIKKAAKPACEEYEVARLDLVGSAARGQATNQSDLDLLVEFRNPEIRASKRFFGFLHHLEDTLDCDIDLLTPGGLRNPYFRQRVLQDRVNLYGG